MQKITPHLWYTDKAEEAAKFYVGIFPNSRIDRVTMIQTDSPSGPAGTLPIVDFTLQGQQFQALGAGPFDPFNHAISFIVNCDSQVEIDHYWNALLDGGKPEACGWLQDRYGVSWRIVATVLSDMMAGPDQEKGKRMTEALLKRVKLDIAELREAYEGK